MSVFGLLLKILDAVPAQRHLAGLAGYYAQRCRGENDADPLRNGEVRLQRAVLPTARIVLDCGANVGNWTREALAVNRALQIHCFEPGAANFLALAKLAVPGQVYCNNMGVGEIEGELTLNVHEGNGELNSLYSRCLDEDEIAGPMRAETVRMTTIDSYLKNHAIQHVDFVKLDVEGHELAALKGMSGALKAGRIDLLQFEYGATFADSRILLRDIFELMQPCGYDFYKILPRRLLPVPKYDRDFENFAYQNWLAARRGWDGLERSGAVGG